MHMYSVTENLESMIWNRMTSLKVIIYINDYKLTYNFQHTNAIA